MSRRAKLPDGFQGMVPRERAGGSTTILTDGLLSSICTAQNLARTSRTIGGPIQHPTATIAVRMNKLRRLNWGIAATTAVQHWD
jgi:hypothetical protein